MEFHRHEYTEFDIESWYVVEDDETRYTATIVNEKIDRVAKNKDPLPDDTEVFSKEELPQRVMEVLDEEEVSIDE